MPIYSRKTQTIVTYISLIYFHNLLWRFEKISHFYGAKAESTNARNVWWLIFISGIYVQSF